MYGRLTSDTYPTKSAPTISVYLVIAIFQYGGMLYYMENEFTTVLYGKKYIKKNAGKAAKGCIKKNCAKGARERWERPGKGSAAAGKGLRSATVLSGRPGKGNAAAGKGF